MGAGSKRTAYGSLRVHGCIVLASSEGDWLLRAVRDNAERRGGVYIICWGGSIDVSEEREEEEGVLPIAVGGHGTACSSNRFSEHFEERTLKA